MKCKKKITMRTKITNNRGFMLGELLVVVIIVGLLTATIAAGIPSVVSAFQRITRTANAQTVMSTAVNEIKGDLRYARTDDLVAENGEHEPVFYNSDGYLMTYKNGDNGIYRVFYRGTDKADADKEQNLNTDSSNYDAQPLLTERDQANGFGQNEKLKISFENFSYNNGVYSLTLKVTGKNQNLSQDIKVRALNQ